jgi:hypothetical protein
LYIAIASVSWLSVIRCRECGFRLPVSYEELAPFTFVADPRTHGHMVGNPLSPSWVTFQRIARLGQAEVTAAERQPEGAGRESERIR